MIDITDHEEKCWAQVGLNKCKLLKQKNCKACSFYKPAGCADWIRIEKEGRIFIVAPEEYEVFNMD